MDLTNQFKYIKLQNPLYSDYICFSKVIENKGYSKDIIESNFIKLVHRKDYSNRQDILDYLGKLTRKKK